MKNVHAQEYSSQYSKYHRISRYEVDNYRIRNKSSEFSFKNKKGFYLGLDLLYTMNDYGNVCHGTMYNGSLDEKCRDARAGAFNEYVGKVSFDDKLYALKMLAGYRFNNFVGAEFFIQQSEEVDGNRRMGDISSIVEYNEMSSFSYKAVGLDFMGYSSITDYYELIGSLGLGWYDFDVSANMELHDTTVDVRHNIPANIGKTTAIGLRAGIGTQVYINNNISAVLMGRYIKMTNDDVVKSMIELSLGMRYLF